MSKRFGYITLTLSHYRDKPVYLTRAWCLYELYTAISFDGACTITAIYTPQQEKLFRAALSSGGYKKIDDTLDEIQSAHATATIKADEVRIRVVTICVVYR